MAPAGAVAALGLCMDEIERLRGEPDYRTRIKLDGSCALHRLGEP